MRLDNHFHPGTGALRLPAVTERPSSPKNCRYSGACPRHPAPVWLAQHRAGPRGAPPPGRTLLDASP
eukprot:1475738-Pyramimonas_sp.AAC.1